MPLPGIHPQGGRSLAFALRFQGRKRVHSGDEYMAAITAERLVRYLDSAGFVVMRSRRLLVTEWRVGRCGHKNLEY
jgi:hypothetical protein